MKKHFLLTLAAMALSFNVFASGNAVETAIQTNFTDAQENAVVADTASPALLAPTPEDQIPLKIVDAGKSASASGGAQRVIFSLGIIVVLAGVGFYAVKRFSHKSTLGKSNMQIKILSQHYLGPKKSLAIVRVAGESILIGVTDHNISMIKSLALLDEELPQVLPKNFSESLTEENDSADVDDFTFEGIKSTVVGKIKSMRNIQ